MYQWDCANGWLAPSIQYWKLKFNIDVHILTKREPTSMDNVRCGAIKFLITDLLIAARERKVSLLSCTFCTTSVPYLFRKHVSTVQRKYIQGYMEGKVEWNYIF